MGNRKAILHIAIFLIVLTFLVDPVSSAYATIDEVIISAPSTCNKGEPIQVQATVTTKRSGWGTCTVRDVQTVLLLPDGVTVTSGDNPTLVGNVNGGTSTRVTWTVVFGKNGTHTIQVRALGSDSNGYSCSASESITVTVGEASPSLVPCEALMAVGILLVVVLASVLILWRRRRI